MQKAIQSKSIKGVPLALWSPKISIEGPPSVVDALSTASSLGIDGWIRWDTDGSRRQVFDAFGRGVCKIQKHGAFFQVNDEVELREKVGRLSPGILKRDAAGTAYVEEWVNISTPPFYSFHDLERVRLALQNCLYRVEKQGIGTFLRNTTVPFSDEAREVIPELVGRMGLQSLPVSQVHGDLVRSNISFTEHGAPVLYDWEYSRVCVVTHDVWFFLYHGLLAHGGHFNLSSFLEEFKKHIDWMFPEHIELLALHLIHLYEREALLLWNDNIVESSQALEKIRESIREARSLLSDECGALGNANCEANIER